VSQPEIAKPLKTWSHLASRRRKPSEYEVVSANLHYTTDNPDAPFELDPNFPMARWFKEKRNASPLRGVDWNAFRDPDEIVYRTYNILQDGQEAYVLGLFDQMSERGHDAMLDKGWVKTLAKLYTPNRYLFHAVQMGSAYLTQIAPSSTITNCGTYQTADSLRWMTHTAYRTAELAQNFPGVGFAAGERERWEKDAAWQGLRELVERALVAYDWGESFAAFQLVVRPVVEETALRALGQAARRNGDTLLGMLTDAQLLDAQRHRRWTSAVCQLALTEPKNKPVLRGWVDAWLPLGDRAVDAYCAALPDASDAAVAARDAVRRFIATCSV
jgi:toluene monooxygenase system protein E